MRTWTPPNVTPLPASGLTLRLHDTRTGRVTPVVPRAPGLARLYVCGITPYDSTHMGHAMTYHAADLMRRALLDAGHRVETAQNITDVDDPLFERAARDDVDWRELADSQTALFTSDMEALRIIPPETYLSVSEAMDGIIGAVLELHDRGRLYPVHNEDGTGQDWYLDLSLDGALGDVSGWDEEQMLEVFAERGGDPDRPGKRGRFDPAVWRAQRPGEPAWHAGELGAGRPGWHVECVCIAQDGLGLPFDIQTGGRDLIFPHHDLSAAHATALGHGFAEVYPHVGMVAYQGEKMSKSLGNLVFVSRLTAQGVPSAAIRLVLLDHHYRSDWEWTDAVLETARARLESYREAAARGSADAVTVQEIRAALREDLDTPRALRALDAWAAGEEPTGALAEKDLPESAPADVVAAVDALLGIDLRG